MGKDRCSLEIIDLGIVAYEEAYKLQRYLIEKSKAEEKDSVLFCEHYPVITSGRGGSEKDILVSREFLEARGISVFPVDRGGEVTYHGPGQLVFYPILNLKRYRQDIHWYLRQLEEVVIRFLSCYNLDGIRRVGHTGVWFAGKKVASIGVGFTRWVSFHGVAINVNVDLTPFSYIRPCGLDAGEMTSVKKILKVDCDMREAKGFLSRSIEKILHAGVTEKDEAVSSLDKEKV